MTYREDIERALDSIREEYILARNCHAPMYSAHEGIAVIREEFEELWEIVKQYPRYDDSELREEAVQLGAMAVAFLVEICKE